MTPPHRSLIEMLRCFGAASLTACLCVAPAWADRADRDQPMNFAADSARVDENKGLNTLSGNVEITKGSIVLRSSKVEVRQQSDGSQNAVATGGPSGRAYFRQKREGVDEFIEGEAHQVEYDGKADQVRFNGRAVMRRLSGGTVSDEVVGQVIVYDNKTEVFQVLGSGGGSSGSAAPAGRVRGVITPRKDPARPAAKAVDEAPSLSTTRTLSKPQLESAR